MKQIIYSMLIACTLWIGAIQQAHSQNHEKVFVGNTKDLLDQLSNKSDKQLKQASPIISIKVDANSTLNASVNSNTNQNGTNRLLGAIDAKSNSSFFLSINGNHAEGKIILRDEKTAYTFSSDAQGNVYVENTDIHKIMCVDFKEIPVNRREKSSTLAVEANANIYALQSLPGSQFVAYLDFDGQYLPSTSWNGGNPINADPSGMTDADIQQAWEIVSEDYRPFNINITTDVNVFNAAQIGRRIRCIVTPTNTAFPGSGGVAYIGSFPGTTDEPCWAFTTGVGTGGKNVGEVCSHEIGHTVGLFHDGRENVPDHEEYYAGQGDWAPIMGVGYYRNITQFSLGEYANANNQQDDIAVITSQNGFSFRPDAQGNTIATATPFAIETNGTVLDSKNFGVIEQRNDIDVFSFTTTGGHVTFSITPSTYANLDILASLYDQNNTLVSDYRGIDLAARFDLTLTAGKYFLAIDGTGQGNPVTDGYSDYASLGYYSISGNIPVSGGNIPPTVSISSPINNANFTAPANISIQANASDVDGTISKVEFFNGSTKLGEDLTSPFSFAWSGVAAGNYNLTAIATDNNGASTTSAIIAIVVNGGTSCNGTPAWNATQVYAAPGQRVSYQGNIFENKWWTQNEAPNKNDQWGVWKFISACQTGNQLPVVSFTSPVNNAVYQEGSTFDIVANASDADGTIQQVALYENNSLVSTLTTAPYKITKTNAIPGTYTYKAIATDNQGGVSADALVTYKVNALPTASFISPVANDVYPLGGTLYLSINASDIDGSVTKVEFFLGSMNNKVAEDLSAPYNVYFSPIPPATSAQGNYLPVIAKITDDRNGIIVIDTYIRVVNNNAPTVTITSPANNSNFTAPATIALSADASDSDGSITKVEFYIDNQKLAEDLTAPYSYVWTNVAAGTHAITARAYDNLNVVGYSSTVNVTINGNDVCSNVPQYMENGGYAAGSNVKNAGRKFECKPWPYSGWCNGAAWAYAPGTGTYWQDAWIDRGSCGSSGAAALSNDAVENAITVSPNPATDFLKVEMKSPSSSIYANLYDAVGNLVISVSDVQSNSTINLSNLPSGIYNLQVVAGSEIHYQKVVKY